jgi:hypothetical protein
MPFKAFPTPPVAPSGIAALIGYAHFSPFWPCKKKKSGGIAPPLFSVGLLVRLAFCFGFV